MDYKTGETLTNFQDGFQSIIEINCIDESKVLKEYNIGAITDDMITSIKQVIYKKGFDLSLVDDIYFKKLLFKTLAVKLLEDV